MKYLFLAVFSILSLSAQAANIDTGVVNSYDSGVSDSNWTWTTGGSNFQTGKSDYGSGGYQAGDKGDVWQYDKVGGGNLDSGLFGGGDLSSGGYGSQPLTSGGVGGGKLTGADKPELTIVGVVNWFLVIFNYIAILLLAMALVSFLYGIVMLMFVGGSNEESRSKGRKFMLWGIVSLFVMVSVWGLVNVLKVSIFGGTNLILPQLK